MTQKFDLANLNDNNREDIIFLILFSLTNSYLKPFLKNYKNFINNPNADIKDYKNFDIAFACIVINLLNEGYLHRKYKDTTLNLNNVLNKDYNRIQLDKDLLIFERKGITHLDYLQSTSNQCNLKNSKLRNNLSSLFKIINYLCKFYNLDQHAIKEKIMREDAIIKYYRLFDYILLNYLNNKESYKDINKIDIDKDLGEENKENSKDKQSETPRKEVYFYIDENKLPLKTLNNHNFYLELIDTFELNDKKERVLV